MNPFQKAIRDIWHNQCFLETAIINGDVFEVVCSKLSNDGIAFVDTGAECPVGFTLDLQLPLPRVPKINEKVKFRERDFKISDIEIDSANTSIKLHLVDMSRGIG